MAEQYFNSDINADGKIKLSTVPNATGTLITYNPITKELSTRTNAQIIADLGLDGSLSAYVKKTGDSMSGALNMNNAVNTTLNKDLSDITLAGGFARDILRLLGTNGTIDTLGWQGTVDSTGNVTMGYGYLGGIGYNVKNAIRWNSNQQVRIGSTGVPGGNYALEIDGATLSRGNFDAQAGAFNTVSGELLVQRFGVNRIRTGSTALILSADTSAGIVYIRPQGDAISTSQLQFRGDNVAVAPDAYNVYFGNQTAAGSDLFHTNLSNTTHGYGLWMGQNLQFNGTDFIQPRGSLTSWGFTVNNHKNFSFNYGSASGTNGSIVTLTELVKINNTGTITTLNHGDSSQWASSYNNGFLYRGTIGNTDLNTIITTGWYVQTGNANATIANNYPAPGGLAGQLRVYATATHLVQEYTTYANNNDVYRRYYFSGTWYAWAKDWDSNDFTQTNINSWNNIAANGATQQWVDQFYVNKSTQNTIKRSDWFITSDYSAGMEDKIRFTPNGYVSIEWDNSRMQFTDEGAIDLIQYGFRQEQGTFNQLHGDTVFKYVEFQNPQGIAPFYVQSTTMIDRLNADLLDGRHASDFVLTSQIGGYVPVTRTITINGVTQDLTANRSWATPTYTAGAGLTLTGTQFSLPVTQTGIGNGVTSVTQTPTGISVVKNEVFATALDLEGYIAKKPLQFRSVSDANNAVGVDFFYLNGSNKPVGSTDGALLNMTYDNSLWNTQMYSDWRTNEWYLRVKSNGSWGSWQRIWHDGNFIPSVFVPQSRTITINGVTQDLSANRTWNIATGSTYSAGAGLTLTGTTFSLPVTISGTGNGVASVVQNSTGITVTKTDFALSSQLNNFVTTNTPQVVTAAKNFTQTITTNFIVDSNGGWMLGYDNNGGEYGMYDYQDAQTLISGSENGFYVYGCEYGTYNGIAINKITRNVNIGGANGPNKLNVNGAVQANGLVGNSSQSSNEVWTTDGGYKDISEFVRPDAQFRLDIDGLTVALPIKLYHDLGVVIYEGGGIEDTTLLLPRITRSGQEVQVINRGNATVLIGKVGNSFLMNLDPGNAFRYVFTIDNNINDFAEDKEGLGTWFHVATEKYTEL